MLSQVMLQSRATAALTHTLKSLLGAACLGVVQQTCRALLACWALQGLCAHQSVPDSSLAGSAMPKRNDSTPSRWQVHEHSSLGDIDKCAKTPTIVHAAFKP